jgi:hypothetical protein
MIYFKQKAKILFIIGFIQINYVNIHSQSSNGTNTNQYFQNRFIGWDNSNGINPLTIRTNNITRMHINGTGVFTNGGNASGFIGIGTNQPSSPLHVIGSQVGNAQGWRRGIILGNSSTLLWDGGVANSFFMAHPSGVPNSNWFAGSQTNLNNNSIVDYAFTVFVNNSLGSINPLNTINFFKNVLVYDQQDVTRRLGINTLNPQQAAEVFSNGTQMRLSWGTTNSTDAVPIVFTDFRTNNFGNLQVMPTGQRVGINLNTNPTATLDVNGEVRIRNLQTGAPNSLLVGTNVSGASDVNVRKLDFPNDATKVLLGNGTWGQNPSSVGNYCSAPTNNLTGNYQIPLNNSNYYFTNNDALGENHVGIGIACNTPLPAKLAVYQNHPLTVNQSTIGISSHNDDVANEVGLNYNGVFGTADGIQVINKTLNRGGYFTAKNSDNLIGVMGEIKDPNQTNGTAFAGNFEATSGAQNNYAVKAMANALSPNNLQNVGVMGEAMNSNRSNIAGLFRTYGPPAITGTNIAVAGYASPIVSPSTFPMGANIGVYGNSETLIDINGVAVGYAGFFDGDVWINGPATGTGYASTFSDANFKTNVLTQENANTILNQLNPKTFYFDTLNIYGLNFNPSLQHGLIAQEVEVILPELVHDQRKPAMLDSIGNIVTPELTYKALDYSAFISILVAGHQEQSLTIDSLKNSNDSLKTYVDEINNRLTQLENCLSGILPFLCQLSQQAIQTNTPETQEAIRSQLTVYLENKETIILDQNVPNPFVEQTVINFSIPESVKNAQILFYNGHGALINTVEIKERGLGSLAVFGSDLSSGTYMYTLVADGIIVSTKKMMKQ